MADVTKYLKMLGGLGIALLVLVVIFAVALLMGSAFKEKVCIQEGSTVTAGVCAAPGVAYNATATLVAQIVSVVGWIGLIVIAAIGGILIAMARSFWTGNDKGM